MRWLFLLFILILSLALAQPSNLQQQLEREISNYQELRENRAEALRDINAQLGENAIVLEARIAERDQLSARLAELRSEQARLQQESVRSEAALADTEARMAVLELEVSSLRKRVEALLVNLYKERNRRYARVLAEADTLHELRVKNYQLSLLSERDITLINLLNKATLELRDLQNTQVQQLNTLRIQQQELQTTEAQLTDAQAALDQAITALETSRQGQLALQADLLREQTSIETSIQQAQNALKEEIRRLEREAEELRRQAESAATEQERRETLRQAEVLEGRLAELGAPLPSLSSQYIYPLNNPTLASRFGEANASYTALRANEAGAAVRAIDNGRVQNVTRISANHGYLVLVQHQGNLVSGYTNLQEPPLVGIGDTVQQGQTLGYLGGGTLLASNILQFYTVVNNIFVDPSSVLGF